MSDEKSAIATLTAGVSFDVALGSGHSLVLDAPPMGGPGTGARPTELLLAALAGCLGITVVGILRKRRLEVAAYTLAVRGTQASAHPQVFTAIAVTHTLTGRDLRPEVVEQAVALAEARYCPVSAMLAKTAAITHSIHLADA